MSAPIIPNNLPATEEERKLQSFCKQLVKTVKFKGFYQERRLVESLNGYRNLIVIDKRENDVMSYIKHIKQRIERFYNNENIWIGITLPEMVGAPAAGVCIWTEMDELPFGEYLFEIKSIRFRQNEIIIKMKSITNSNVGDNSEPENLIDENVSMEKILKLLDSWKVGSFNCIFTFLSTEINRENIFGAIRFLALLMLSFTQVSIEAIKYLGIFTLRFMTEFRLLIKTLTPIILKLIDVFSKIIGGFFILILHIWRDIWRPSERPYINMIQAPQYDQYNRNNRYIKY